MPTYFLLYPQVKFTTVFLFRQHSQKVLPIFEAVIIIIKEQVIVVFTYQIYREEQG